MGPQKFFEYITAMVAAPQIKPDAVETEAQGPGPFTTKAAPQAGDI